MRKIIIETDTVTAEAVLYDTAPAEEIWKALPVSGSANRWGQEIYFSIGLNIDPGSDATDVMPVGSLAYWPPGKAFCILFGETPASGPDGTPTLASAGAHIGEVTGSATVFDKVSAGTTVRVRAADGAE